MWTSKGTNTRKGIGGGTKQGLVAVAIDKDKGSQFALKWAVENLLTRGQTVILIHVHKTSHHNHTQNFSSDDGSNKQQQLEKITKDLFLTFRCFCTRKDIQCLDIVLEDHDIVRSLVEYVTYAAIEILVLGVPTRHGFLRRFRGDVPTSVVKGAPDFCTTYVISKGKITSVRNACRPAAHPSPLLPEIQNQSAIFSDEKSKNTMSFRDRSVMPPRKSIDDTMKSPFSRITGNINRLTDFSESDTDISFVSSSRPSTDRASSYFDYTDSNRVSRVSISSDISNDSRPGMKFNDQNSLHDFSSVSQDSGSTGSPIHGSDEADDEMRRLKIELKQTMTLYSTACKEALQAKQKAMELQCWRVQEERRIEEARFSEETAMSIVEKERAKCQAAIEAAEASKRIAEIEAQRRLNAETKALKESEEMKRVLSSLTNNDTRYRRYTIEEIEEATERFAQSRKIGEGGYGPVYKCYLDHTRVAVKVLRPDAAQGMSQFQKEIEVLSCIRHPNMVLLLGACPEYGILVYEFMARGSLDDQLFRRGNSPALSWQLRFRICAEIATGLLFLHQTKPEPLVHRDLKPGNILLDQNYVSKIADVGLARLVPAIAENVTQYHMTATAGTFCYIDPEYQQTGMLGVKSDIYSLGIMLLQIITAKPPMGLAHHVQHAIENGTLEEMLDPTVADWPVEEALSLAKISVQCAELRRKDRPDLSKVVLPELNRLRELAEENMEHIYIGGSSGPSPNMSRVNMSQQSMASNPSLQSQE